MWLVTFAKEIAIAISTLAICAISWRVAVTIFGWMEGLGKKEK